MHQLRLAPDLALPHDTVTQTLVVYGGKGMGKTNFGTVLCEELATAKLRFAVLDPMGVFYGLRHARDGQGPGIEVLVLGGRHGDILIEPTAGAVVADLVADEDVDVVIDVSRRADGKMWSLGERIRFVADYCTRLYERQGERARPLMQVIDEAGRFVPQLVPHGAPDVARCVGAVERMVEEGRNVGIGVCLITQRSARMNKSVSELAECMVAFRTVGPRSIGAILDWFGEHVEKARWKTLIGQLRSLPRGRALVVSPGWLGVEGLATIRERRTFDSSATPRAGQERRAAGPGAKPNLERYRSRMAATIERAKAEDPRALRKTVAALEAEVTRLKAAPAPAPTATPVEVAILRPAEIARLETAARTIERVGTGIVESVQALTATLTARRGSQALPGPRIAVTAPSVRQAGAECSGTATSARPTIVPTRARPSAEPSVDGLPRMARAILTALAQHPVGLTKGQVLIHADYRASGPVSKTFAELTRHGWMQSMTTGRVQITDAGLAGLGPFDPLPIGAALRAHVLNDPGPMERAFLAVLFDVHPASIGKGQLLEKTGYAASGPVSKTFAKLVALGWAKPAGRGTLKAAEEFFEGEA